MEKKDNFIDLFQRNRHKLTKLQITKIEYKLSEKDWLSPTDSWYYENGGMDGWSRSSGYSELKRTENDGIYSVAYSRQEVAWIIELLQYLSNHDFFVYMIVLAEK